VISIGRHLGSLLLGLATSALLLSGLAVALPATGWSADLATALGTAVRSAAIVDGPQLTDQDTVAAPISRVRTVPRALVADQPVPTTPAAAETRAAPAEQTEAPRTAAAKNQKASGTTKAASAAKTTSAPASATAKPKPARGPVGAVVAATNAEREDAGCGPVTLDSRLSAAAQGHASDMAANDYFSHTDQDGGDSSDRMHDAGFSGSRTGENIAYGQETGAEVVATWMDSSGHRHNILNCDYDRIGVGYDPRGDYWVQDFGG
jgi:uncharacterized protein YkwD